MGVEMDGTMRRYQTHLLDSCTDGEGRFEPLQKIEWTETTVDLSGRFERGHTLIWSSRFT